MKVMFGLLVLCLMASSVHAATVKQLATCSGNKNAVERLACFDNLAKTESADAPTTETADKGDWRVTSQTSKINDKTNVFLVAESIDEVRQRYGDSAKAAVNIVCREGHTDIYLTFGNNFLADIQGYGELTLRLDKRPAKKIHMSESTDHMALGLWNGVGGKLIKSMFGANHLFVEVTPFNESAVTAEFRIAGLEQAIEPLRKACKW